MARAALILLLLLLVNTSVNSQALPSGWGEIPIRAPSSKKFDVRHVPANDPIYGYDAANDRLYTDSGRLQAKPGTWSAPVRTARPFHPGRAAGALLPYARSGWLGVAALAAAAALPYVWDPEHGWMGEPDPGPYAPGLWRSFYRNPVVNGASPIEVFQRAAGSSDPCPNGISTQGTYNGFPRYRCHHQTGWSFEAGMQTPCPAGTVWNGASCVNVGLVPVDESALIEQLQSLPWADVVPAAQQSGISPAPWVDDEPAEVAWPSAPPAMPAPIVETRTRIDPSGATTTETVTSVELAPAGRTIQQTETTTTTTNRPDGTTETVTDEVTGGAPTAPEEHPDLCELHPDASACKPLGELPDDVPLQSQERSIELVKKRSASGSCPAPQSFNTGFGSVTVSWDLLCSFSQGIRPLLIGLSWLFATLWVVSTVRAR